MSDLKFDAKESIISALSWGAYGGTLFLTKDTDAADAIKSAVESLGGMVSLQEKDSISKKVSGFCRKSWDFVLKQYGAEVLKAELRKYNFASDPFHWDNALTIQARIMDACRKKKISIVKVPYRQISESVVTQLSKMMDDDPQLMLIFLMKEARNEKKEQSLEKPLSVEAAPVLTKDMPAPIKLYGRESVVADILDLLKDSDIVCIHADGGVGKTAVAAAVMDEIRKEVSLGQSGVEHFAWITSSGNLKNDLLFLNVPAAKDLKTEIEKLEAVTAFLQKHSTFLVIDNMDSFPDRDDRSLLNTLKGKTKILITSRIPLSNLKLYRLEDLNPDPALKLFYRCYLGDNEQDAEELKLRKDAEFAKKILDKARYNALLIELIGKMASWEYCGNLGELWEKHKDNIFLASSEIDIDDTEHSASHRLSENDLKLQDHIRRLYALSGLSKERQEIMNFMAQFPAEMSVFRDILDWAGFNINDLKWLVDRAWIEQTEEGFFLHTMVRGSIWKQGIGFDIWKYGNLIYKLGKTNDYMPVTAGYVTVRKKLKTVSILGSLIAEDTETKLVNTEGRQRLLENAGAFLNDLAIVYQFQGNYEEAMKYLEKALEIREKVLGDGHPDTAGTYNNLAGVNQYLGNYDLALKLFNKALVISEKILGKNHPFTAATSNNMASVYYAIGDYEKALEYYSKALVIKEKVLGKEHPDTASTYNNLAGVYDYQGNQGQALKYYGKALDIRKKVLGEEHPDTASTYNNLGIMYWSQGNYEEALKYLGKALAIKEKVLGEGHPETAGIYNNLAGVYHLQGNYEEALEYYGKALEISEKMLGKEHPETASMYNNLAIVYDYQGNYGEALKYYSQALDIRKKVLGEKHPETATAYNNLANVYQSQGNYKVALKYYGKALDIKEKALGEDHPSTTMTYNNLAILFYSMKDYKKAEVYCKKALSKFEKVLGNEHPFTKQSRDVLAIVEKALKR